MDKLKVGIVGYWFARDFARLFSLKWGKSPDLPKGQQHFCHLGPGDGVIRPSSARRFALRYHSR